MIKTKQNKKKRYWILSAIYAFFASRIDDPSELAYISQYKLDNLKIFSRTNNKKEARNRFCYQ